MSEVDVYSVGWLHAWQQLHRWRSLRREWGYVGRQARRGNWRAVRMTFNGYLAEPRVLPTGLRRIGSGWTKRRALRDLARHVEAIRRLP